MKNNETLAKLTTFINLMIPQIANTRYVKRDLQSIAHIPTFINVCSRYEKHLNDSYIKPPIHTYDLS